MDEQFLQHILAYWHSLPIDAAIASIADFDKRHRMVIEYSIEDTSTGPRIHILLGDIRLAEEA